MEVSEKNTGIIQNIMRVYRLTRKHMGWGLLRLFGGILSASIAAYSSWMGGKLVDIALSRDINLFISYIYVLLVVMVMRTTVSYLNPFANQRYAFLSGRTLRRITLDKITRLPIAYYENKHSGETISQVTNDIDHLQWFCGNLIASLWSYVPAMLIISGYLLFKTNLVLTLICCTTVPVISYVIGKISKPISAASKSIQVKVAEYNTYLREFTEGVHVYKAYNMKKHYHKKFKQKCEEVAEEACGIARKRSIGFSLNIINSLIPKVLAYGVGSIYVMNGRITVGGLIIFANVLVSFIDSLEQILRGYQQILRQEGRARHLFELLDAAEERTDGEDFSNEITEKVIEFRNVSFQYNESQEVLRSITFDVKRGQKVALAGMSGSGKSTIHKLVCGFYNNYEGEIRINGREIREWNLDKLRGNIGIVSQEVFLFNDTIMENVRYGNINATDEEIIDVCKKAYVHEFVKDFKNGYDTIVGERGSLLSQGQKQRIGIARAMLKDAPILLLDEPTSALDTKSEHYVQLALETLTEGKTVFIIAHRLSTIINADKIIVLDDGSVAEEGTHDQLIRNQQFYSSLYQKELSNA
jgi:ABC-type multidrug transport system fused ATPase/permease subunit